MIERRKQELNLVKVQHGELEVDENLGWFIIKNWKLPSGWNRDETEVLIFIPAGYPVTPPDNFHTDFALRLANDGQPGSTGHGSNHAGRQWLTFSYHVEAGDWQPHADPLKGHNLLTLLQVVAKRLSEVN